MELTSHEKKILDDAQRYHVHVKASSRIRWVVLTSGSLAAILLIVIGVTSSPFRVGMIIAGSMFFAYTAMAYEYHTYKRNSLLLIQKLHKHVLPRSDREDGDREDSVMVTTQSDHKNV